MGQQLSSPTRTAGPAASDESHTTAFPVIRTVDLDCAWLLLPSVLQSADALPRGSQPCRRPAPRQPCLTADYWRGRRGWPSLCSTAEASMSVSSAFPQFLVLLSWFLPTPPLTHPSRSGKSACVPEHSGLAELINTLLGYFHYLRRVFITLIFRIHKISKTTF